MEGYLGVIRFFAGTFAPRGWMFCEGQILSISEYTTLYAIIGTYYGGNGRTTFQLPDLRQRAAIGTGRGPGLNDYSIGEYGGYTSIALTEEEMPNHSHVLTAELVEGDESSPKNAYPAVSNGVVTIGRDNYPYLNEAYSSEVPNTQMNSVSLGTTGQNEAHDNMQPFLACNYIICVDGLFPARS